MKYSPFSLMMLLLACCRFAAAEEAAKADKIDYARQVAPLLTKYCGGCHNDSDREGKLSLESYGSLLKGGPKGSVVTAGQGDLSRMVVLMRGKAEPKMPPKDNEVPSEAEISLIQTWIDQGATGPEGSSGLPTLVTPVVPLKGPVKQRVNAIAVSPQGDRVAVARFGEVEIQTLADKKPVFKHTGHLGSVNGVAFSQDGKFVAAAAGEPGLFGQAKIWNMADGSLIKEFTGHKDSLYSVAISPNGLILATGSYDYQIKLWDIATGQELRTLAGHNGAVFDLAFRHDGKVLASCSGDRTVKLWDVATGQRLDTLKESLKELYTLAFSPDGTKIAAGGVDNRIRVWQVTPEAKEGSNLLLVSQFAHEYPVLRVNYSTDGSTLVSTGEDRLIKVWNAETMTIRATLEKQSDWVSGVSIVQSANQLIVGRVDGSSSSYPLPPKTTESESPLVPLADVPVEVDYGPQPTADQLPKVAELEPNDLPAQATPLTLPGMAQGRIFVEGGSASPDADLYKITAKAGDQWILETTATGENPQLDTKLEVLDATGLPVPRVLLRAVRDSEIEFRGMNSEQRGVRLKNWDEMLLNEYVYLGGDVIKQFQQRRGPDADSSAYPENGNRFAYFETTSRAHALGEPAYVVVPYAVGTKLPNNGLPVFTINYENDDQAQRRMGKNSQVTFVAPADGTYLVRVKDVRGFGDEKFTYKIVVRRPVPDFKVTLSGQNPTINAGSGKPFSVKAERFDNFNGPIRVDITGLPPGFQATTPIIIPAGLLEAQGVISTLADAPASTEANWNASKVVATAQIAGKEVTHEVGNLGAIKLAEKPKVVVYLELMDQPATAATVATGFPAMPQLNMPAGGTITCKLRVERNGFNDRIAFDVANLPHGVIVDDIGLSGILIPEGKTERTVFLRSEPWVTAQSRPFFATAQVEGNQVSLPLQLNVVPPIAAR